MESQGRDILIILSIFASLTCLLMVAIVVGVSIFLQALTFAIAILTAIFKVWHKRSKLRKIKFPKLDLPRLTIIIDPKREIIIKLEKRGSKRRGRRLFYFLMGSFVKNSFCVFEQR